MEREYVNLTTCKTRFKRIKPRILVVKAQKAAMEREISIREATLVAKESSITAHLAEKDSKIDFLQRRLAQCATEQEELRLAIACEREEVMEAVRKWQAGILEWETGVGKREQELRKVVEALEKVRFDIEGVKTLELETGGKYLLPEPVTPC